MERLVQFWLMRSSKAMWISRDLDYIMRSGQARIPVAMMEMSICIT